MQRIGFLPSGLILGRNFSSMSMVWVCLCKEHSPALAQVGNVKDLKASKFFFKRIKSILNNAQKERKWQGQPWKFGLANRVGEFTVSAECDEPGWMGRALLGPTLSGNAGEVEMITQWRAVIRHPICHSKPKFNRCFSWPPWFHSYTLKQTDLERQAGILTSCFVTSSHYGSA